MSLTIKVSDLWAAALAMLRGAQGRAGRAAAMIDLKHLGSLSSLGSGARTQVVDLCEPQPSGGARQVQAELRLGMSHAGLDQRLVAPADMPHQLLVPRPSALVSQPRGLSLGTHEQTAATCTSV